MKHDLQWFMGILRETIWDSFDLKPYEEDTSKVKKKSDDNGGEDIEDVHKSMSKNSQLKSNEEGDDGKRKTPDDAKSYHDPSERVWPIDDEENLWYSIMNMDVDGYYCEFKSPEKSTLTIEQEIHQKIQS